MAAMGVAQEIVVTAVDPTSLLAQRAMRGYIEDVASRYYGRAATPAEVDAALLQHPTDELLAPYGVFLVASVGDDVGGCVGLARVHEGLGEVRRLHVDRRSRRKGLGRRLMGEVEKHAGRMGLDTLRLDTRRDLVESQRLYESFGYVDSPPHSGGPFSDRWFTKTLI